MSVAIVGAASLVACTSQPQPTAPQAPVEPLTVRVAQVVETEIAERSEAGGVVQAATTATLASRVLAPIREIRVAPGDRVRQGQVVVLLDGRDLLAGAQGASAAVDQARLAASVAREEKRAADAALRLSRATRDRIVALHSRRSATPQELDQATSAFEAAEARVAAAVSRIEEASAGIDRAVAESDRADATADFLQIAAPFDGLVTEKMVEPGNMAAPGAPLLRIEDTRVLRLEVRVDASRVSTVTVGDKVDVQVDGPGGDPVMVSGVVSEVSRAVDVDARAVLVKITLTGASSLRSGVFGRVRLLGSTHTGVVIPVEAVRRQGQVRSVFVADGDVARLRVVRMRDNEVVAGLKAGERVIVGPPADLVDGRAIRVGEAR